MEQQQRQTLAEFIERAGITAKATPADSNPYAVDFGDDARHWLVRLRRERRSLAIPFSQGSAHTEPPTAADVLECLALDGAGIANASSFEEWASEYGYDTDSRKGERAYRATLRQADRLAMFLGPELYSALLWDTEND